MLTAAEWSALRLSLLVSATAVLLLLPIAVAAGYALARWTIPCRWLVELLLNLPLVLPPVVTGFLLLVIMGQKGLLGSWLAAWGVRIVFTWWGAVLASGVMAFPLMVRTMRLAFGAVDPRYEQVARTLGASPWRAFLSVALPLAMPGISAAVVLGFARGLSEFGATIMVAGNIAGQTRTLPLAIYSATHRPDGWEEAWRLVLLSIAVAAVSLFLADRFEQRQNRHAVR